MPDYGRLSDYLRKRHPVAVTLSFAEVARIVGGLPKSAHRHNAWWSNTTTSHPHAQSWIGAGYRTRNVNIAGQSVEFFRASGAQVLGHTGRTEKPGPDQMNRLEPMADAVPNHTVDEGEVDNEPNPPVHDDFEQLTRELITNVLSTLGIAERYACTDRKQAAGKSAIGRPVDLHIVDLHHDLKPVVCIEVANVNATQLVGEATRLYFDSCPLKIMALGSKNTPKQAIQICEEVLCRLYNQDKIEATPARVARYDDTDSLKQFLVDFLRV